ncbi:hypothetical protein B0H13DRAFT_2280151 [Mycena leptocephala]|nr:hypothetical protein B0H13DRAFT_2280151 [Mycena leptocephala]
MASSPNPYILVPVSTVLNGDGHQHSPTSGGGGLASNQNSKCSLHSNSNGAGGGFPASPNRPSFPASPTRQNPRTQSCSEDIRSGSALFPYEGGENDFLRSSNQYLSPVEPPPSISGHRYYRSASSGGSVRSERGGLGGGSQRPSPYPSPNVSPAPRYSDLPSAAPIVSKQKVTTVRTSKASHNRRKQEATFICLVPGCGSTFMLAGVWEGVYKQFARMDALNSRLRSEGGAECQRTLEANGRMPDFSGAGLMPMPNDGGGRPRSYSAGSYHEGGGSPQPPHLRMPGGMGGGGGVTKTEDPWANMNGVAL